MASSVDNYDVFINFRGADTRQGFVKILYEDLVGEGVRVFLDNEELTYGKRLDEELPQAIKNSKIYITVLSETYASSKWCLRELAEIVRNKQEFKDKKEILPVFYRIKTDDVKLKTDLFNNQLNSLKEKVRAESVQEWAEALKGIPKVRGWTVPIHGSYEDRDCCREIVKRVSIILRVKHKQLPKDLIGMEDPVKEVMQLLDIGNPGFQVIGIHGMGGSGKTTLAKAVYNKLCDDKFDSCCFMSDVRESLDKDKGSKGCLELQKKLLKEVSYHGNVDEITDVDDAVRRIQLTLQGKNVLMVFDDVSKSKQIVRLIGDKYTMFGRESRVIITTRDDRVLRNREFVEFSKIHEMKAMENEHALELFSWHAFGQQTPPEEYSLLSNDAVSLTGRLPLSLEITGSLFFVGGRKNWKQTVEKLKKMPHEDVLERLKISYEDLEEGTKEIFLDIACFFVDEKISHNEAAMWDACGFFPELAIEELISMCLIKLQEDANQYWMHDHIKDVGREIVRLEEPKDKEQRSRIWKEQDAIDILTASRKKENNKIEGILLKHGTNDDEKLILRGENCVNLDRLRFLHLDQTPEVQVEGSFKHLLPNLRWLFLPWLKMMRFNATDFSLKKLVVLSFLGSDIDENWAGWKEFKELPSLEILDLSGCHSLKKTPDLSHYTSLKKLFLLMCLGLEEIDCSITSLPKLQHLDLTACMQLKKLPDSIGELGELEVLLLIGCEALVSLPNSLTSLPKLHTLNLLGCKSLESFPDSVGDVVFQLTELNISDSALKKLPGFISKQKRLEKLSLERCNHLQQLPAQLPTSLVQLHVKSDSLQSIPDYSNLIHLTELTLGVQPGANFFEVNLSWVWRLSKLKKLHMGMCCTTQINESSSVSLLSQLEELKLSCLVLGTYVIPSFLSALTRLEMTLFMGTTTSLSLPRLNRLTHFKLSVCANLEKILGLGELESLITLEIEECHSLERLEDISKLRLLQTLKISKCKDLRVISVVPCLRSLKELKIDGCELLESLVGPSEESESYLEGIRRVKRLEIVNCPLLENKLPDVCERRLRSDRYWWDSEVAEEEMVVRVEAEEEEMVMRVEVEEDVEEVSITGKCCCWPRPIKRRDQN